MDGVGAGNVKIGYLVQQFPPEVGAGPARVVEMARRWRSVGAEVTIITALPNRPQGRIYPEYRGVFFQREMWEDLDVLRSWVYARPEAGFGRTLLNNLTFMTTAGLHGLVRSGDLDVLIASSPPFFVHPAGAAHSFFRRIPLVLELRDLWPDYLVGMGKLENRVARACLFGLERILLRRAEEVVVVTESFRRRVEEKGVDPDRIHVVPNGVDLQRYRPAGPRAAEVATADFIVGYLGNFGAGQDLSVLIEAAELVAARDPSIRFVLVGDGPERRKLEERVRRTAARVTIEAPITKDQTAAFYTACDVCVVPLADVPVFQETIPSKLFEILASGRPVLGSLAGEGAAVISESGGGIVCPPGDPVKIAEGVLRLRRMPAERRWSMGREGRAYVREHYSRNDLADHYLELLRTVVKRRRAENSDE